MFYATKQNKYIVEGTAFELDEVQYPQNWLNLSTPEEKAALGLQEVIATNEAGDDRFYWVSETLDKAILTYINTPKHLDDSEEEDESGKLVKTTGLKTAWTINVKQIVFTLLSPTDYIDIRNLRDPSYKPEWMTWRDSVRDYSATTVAAIAACTTVDELANIVTGMEWPHDPNYVPPVEETPVKVVA